MRDIESLREYCLAKPGATESLPFGPDTLVFKVMGKMFALVGLDVPELLVNLKADPALSESWRAAYPEVQPGWHMNKTHWNTVDFEGSLELTTLQMMVDHSYEQVVKSLKKSDREALSLRKSS